MEQRWNGRHSGYRITIEIQGATSQGELLLAPHNVRTDAHDREDKYGSGIHPADRSSAGVSTLSQLQVVGVLNLDRCIRFPSAVDQIDRQTVGTHREQIRVSTSRAFQTIVTSF